MNPHAPAPGGIYSTQEPHGPGGRSHKVYWVVQAGPGEDILVQPLNANFVPAGKVRSVDPQTFAQVFLPEPDYLLAKAETPTAPEELRLPTSPREPARIQLTSPLPDAAMGDASHVHETNIRANFELALRLYGSGDTTQARDIMERILNLEAPFETQHKHLFNDCGVALRKQRDLEQALRFYRRAAKLTTDDENLFHNMARAYYEKGDIENAFRNLRRSLSLNPDLEASQKFLQWLQKRPKDAQKTKAAAKPGSGRRRP